MKALIDSGAQVSTITDHFARELRLEVRDVGTLLNLEGTGGGEVPYSGYVEANLKIPSMPNFSRDILLLVVPNSRYGEKVPVALGTLAIDMVLNYIHQLGPGPPDLGDPWRRGSAGRSIPIKSCQVTEDGFPLTKVKGKVIASRKITLGAFETQRLKGLCSVREHRKRVNVITEPTLASGAVRDVEVINVYGFLKPGSSRVPVVIKNLSARTVTIRKGDTIAEVAPANVVPAMLAPQPTEEGSQPPSKKVTDKDRKKILLEKLDLKGLETWPEKYQKQAKDLLSEFHDIFALDDLEMGHTKIVKHKIRLSNPVPFKDRYRRIPPHQYEEVRKHLDEMVKVGAIRKSQSPWASAVVLVRKKDGSLRFCIDLRKLNERTIKDAYSLPRIEDSLDTLNGAILFSSIDLKSGYWQVELSEESIPYTAFTVGPLGFFECVRMPFGLTNAPATFQRLMETCLGDMHLNWCIIYLDDVIVFSKDIPSHLERLRGVFTKLREAGLKLKPSKCEFFREKIHYLGHVVSKLGIETDQTKIEAIRAWPRPQTVTDVRSFLGFTNYYRKFIRKYAQVAKPLNLLIAGDMANKKKAKVTWGTECEEAFQTLKEICSNTPVLAYADYGREFILQTDASEKGLGGVLSQVGEDGKERVIAYASRTLKCSERNYSAHKLEFLALKWCVSERFHEYLYGGHFRVYTDNNPLTYILTSAKLDATGHRWVAALALYDFKLYYKAGRLNQAADALSRIEWGRGSEQDYEVMEEAVVKAILSGDRSGEVADLPIPASDGQIVVTKTLNFSGTASLADRDWKVEQDSDPEIGPVFRFLQGRGEDPAGIPAAKTIWRNKKNLVLKKGLLFKKVHLRGVEGETFQFALPWSFRRKALAACHDDFGHLGMDRTLILLQERFYWPNMSQDVRNYIRECPRCLKAKTLPQRPPLQPILCSYPMEIVHLDFLTVGRKEGDAVNILVVTDHFTRLAGAYVTPSQTAPVVAKTLSLQFFREHGWPEKIITDQGKSFECTLIREFCALLGIQKIRTCCYRPQGNGQCERFNSTLLSMITSLPATTKTNWEYRLSALSQAYNMTTSATTGYSPFYLMHGRVPRLPIEVQLGIPDVTEKVTTTTYVRRLQEHLSKAFAIARDCSGAAANKSKMHHDRKTRFNRLEVGDLVMVKVNAFGRDHKIADRWEQVPHKVLKVLGHSVFTVAPVTKLSKSFNRHRAQLFPISSAQADNLMTDLVTASKQVTVV